MAPHRPISGIAVFIMRKQGSFLFGLRLGSHGHRKSKAFPNYVPALLLTTFTETWGLPGGHLEYKESFEECAARETLEETGLQIHNTKFLTTTNDFHEKEQRHGVTMFMTAELVDANATAVIMEPTKCGEWRWQSFQPIVNAVEKMKRDQEPAEQYFLPLYNLVKQRPDIAERLVDFGAFEARREGSSVIP